MHMSNFFNLIILSSVFCFACQSDSVRGRQDSATSSAHAQDSNTKGSRESSLSSDTQNMFAMATGVQPPSAFNISDSDIETFFAMGEKEGKATHSGSGSKPQVFGTTNEVEFLLPAKAKLKLSIALILPRDEARLWGYTLGRRGSPKAERAAILGNLKNLLAERRKKVFFHTAVTTWSDPQSGDENTPSVKFFMKDAGDNLVSPVVVPQLDFCVGFDLISCVAGTEITFPLYSNEQPLLTSSMVSVALMINVDEIVQGTTFGLK